MEIMKFYDELVRVALDKHKRSLECSYLASKCTDFLFRGTSDFSACEKLRKKIRFKTKSKTKRGSIFFTLEKNGVFIQWEKFLDRFMYFIMLDFNVVQINEPTAIEFVKKYADKIQIIGPGTDNPKWICDYIRADTIILEGGNDLPHCGDE